MGQRDGGDATGRSGASGTLTLDELVALNDEIVALVRSGLPLEQGLLNVGGDLRGRLGAITRNLAQRMGQGASLGEALEAEGRAVPPVYKAVVEAGLKAGRLSSALEGLAEYARGYSEMRRAIGLALTYPLIVASLAYALFVASTLMIAPRFVAAFGSLGLPLAGGVAFLDWLGRNATYWVALGPLILILIIWAWSRSGSSKALRTSGLGRRLAFVPGLGSVFSNMRASNFASMLALLIEHQVPYAEALDLASEASGDPALRAAGARAAEAARRGEDADPTNPSPRDLPGLPPLMVWLLSSGQRHETLVAALRHAAESYRRRAVHRAELARVFVPAVMLLLIGAGATLLYGLTLFVPLSVMLDELAGM